MLLEFPSLNFLFRKLNRIVKREWNTFQKNLICLISLLVLPKQVIFYRVRWPRHVKERGHGGCGLVRLLRHSGRSTWTKPQQPSWSFPKVRRRSHWEGRLLSEDVFREALRRQRLLINDLKAAASLTFSIPYEGCSSSGWLRGASKSALSYFSTKKATQWASQEERRIFCDAKIFLHTLEAALWGQGRLMAFLEMKKKRWHREFRKLLQQPWWW